MLVRRAVLLLILVPLPAVAQQHDGQVWLQVNTNVPVSRDVRVTLEQIGRWSDRQAGLYQTEFGGLLGYKVVDGVEIGVGYRKVGFHSRNTGMNEDRLRQQVVLTRGRLLARLRMDERFSDAGGAVGVRVRPLLRYTVPLRDGGPALFISHESFLLPNSTRWGQRRGYERMRNIFGVTLPLFRGVSADVGYLNQYRIARGGARAEMDHALNLQLTISLADGLRPFADD
jgi:hypothetical protein